MKFYLNKPENKQNFKLVYYRDEYSFGIEPHNQESYTSILINEVQLEIDETGRLMYVWGYCPLLKAQETKLFPKDYKKRSLRVELKHTAIPGISHRLNNERWPVYLNPKSNWICIGNPEELSGTLIEFAPGCVLSMNGEIVYALWLHPTVIDN